MSSYPLDVGPAVSCVSVGKSDKPYYPQRQLDFNEDPNPDVFAFHREAPAQVPDLGESRGDAQIWDPAHPTEEERVIMKNASKACAKCPGHCCLAFNLNWTIEEVGQKLESATRELQPIKERVERHVTLMTFHEKGTLAAPWLQDAYRRIEDLEDQVHTFGFFKDRLIPVTDGPKQGWGHTYRCAAFDVKERRCTEYASRPKLCRKYICMPAVEGKTPAFGHMLTSNSPSTMKIIRKQDIYSKDWEFAPRTTTQNGR